MRRVNKESSSSNKIIFIEYFSISLVLATNNMHVKSFKLRNFNDGPTTRGMIRVRETKSRQMRDGTIA